MQIIKRSSNPPYMHPGAINVEPSVSPFQSRPLWLSSGLAEYDLYRAALEWDLTEPIIIENRNDLRSETKWRELVKPYYHQVTNLITFCRRLPVTLLADDVGLGKTISAGLIASELISRGRVTKILIVCPKLLMPQWREELDVKFGIPAIEVVGSELIDAQPPGEAGAVITTYQSARLHLDALSHTGFEMLILDEAHKLRNLYGVDRPPLVAQRFRQALADRVFKYVLMLTATPIQNRLWDLYSLIDLLTVARGHDNPFGTEGMFARDFIADNRTQARHLRPEKQDQFRSIVYGYMSRVRRGDANLHFPERLVQLHSVEPTADELELIKVIAVPIQSLNRLAQISVLQALMSSPHALLSQIRNMSAKGTVPASLATDVQSIVERITVTAKLRGLGILAARLRKEKPEQWRMVVFTTRRETQTTIQNFLEESGIRCGLINGESGTRNQATIAHFKKDPPDIHVIVSTEAGSEGINLQAANVLVNCDLPWNPMIVEQRIGRIQRLKSEHATVCVFNIVLRGTFEEYIVARLMEKVQMASHAIGDIESLLEASGLDDGEENGSIGFEEKIRQLVVASLAGTDVQFATRAAEQSITDARLQLEREAKEIDSMLGGMDGVIDDGPRSPNLPAAIRSMDPRTFALAALAKLGARITPDEDDTFICELEGRHDLIRFYNGSTRTRAGCVLYEPGALAFERLAHRIANTAQHVLVDADQNSLAGLTEVAARDWVLGFGGSYKSFNVEGVLRCFEGTALLRVRATVAHDSYERLVEVECSANEEKAELGRTGLEPLSNPLVKPESLGIDVNRLTRRALEDTAILEFCRFYIQRGHLEVNAAGDDERKRKKLADDFTPRIEIVLVGLNGKTHRESKGSVSYSLDGDANYSSSLVIVPSVGKVICGPELLKCDLSSRTVPSDCLGKCAISGRTALQHLLVQSEVSMRCALPEYAMRCSLSGKRAFTDELERSSVTGNFVIGVLLKTSAMSGKRAEPTFFGKCNFTSTEVLNSELAESQISGLKYRVDEQIRSAVSGKLGHQSEFVVCVETRQPLLMEEADKCEITGNVVMPGHLDQCSVSGMKVLPRELEASAATGKRALSKFLVTSSLSGARILEQESLRSVAGKFCTSDEAKLCVWSGRQSHPDDIRSCELTAVRVHFSFTTTENGRVRLEPLVNLLNGVDRTTALSEIWPKLIPLISSTIGGGSCKIESAIVSPNGQSLAICIEVRTWLGLKTRKAGLLYSIRDQSVVGRVVIGKREKIGWSEV